MDDAFILCAFGAVVCSPLYVLAKAEEILRDRRERADRCSR